MQRPFQIIITLLAVLLATVGAGFFSFPPTGISTFWPPNAILFGSMLSLGPRDRKMCLLLAFPIYFVAELWIGFSLVDAAIFSAVNCIAIVAGLLLTQRMGDAVQGLVSLRTLGVLLVAVVVASLVGGAIGSSWVALSGGPFAMTLLRWALADFIGYVVFVPVILTLADWARWLRSAEFLAVAEANLSALLIIILTLLAYGPLLQTNTDFHGTEFVPIPVLLWIGMRFGPKGAAVGVMIVSVLALVFAIQDVGPFSDLSPAANVASLQVFILSLSTASLVVAVLLHERDEAQQKSLELERQNKEARFRTLVDLATDGIMIFDMDNGGFIESNPRSARIFGYSTEQLCNTIGPAQLSPEFQPDGRRSEDASRGYLMDALEGNFPTFEWTHLNASGEEFPCEISLARYPDPERNLVRASIVDLSEKKALEAQREELQGQLVQAQKLEAVGQLTGGVAHDFNNLLSVILGNLELLKEEMTDKSLTPLIDAAVKATLRGADLTKNLLNFARRAVLSPRRISLSDVVAQMDNWIARTMPAHISVRKSLAQDVWDVEADPAATENALLNLMINARDATEDGGVITIETTNFVLDAALDTGAGDELQPGKYVVLSVSDSGTGMTEESAAHAFEPFYTTKEAGAGSGLGLSMIHGFMRQSKGAARIYSELGVGTTVKLYFPAALSDQVAADDPIPDCTPDNRSETIRILVAEDQAEVSKIIVRILEKAGHEVVSFLTGDAAFDWFEEDDAFDLLITDIVMPGKLQGPELARRIRKLKPCIPVIFMSGYAREATIHGNGLRESDVRLMKPVSKQDLLAAIEAVTSSES